MENVLPFVMKNINQLRLYLANKAVMVPSAESPATAVFNVGSSGWPVRKSTVFIDMERKAEAKNSIEQNLEKKRLKKQSKLLSVLTLLDCNAQRPRSEILRGIHGNFAGIGGVGDHTRKKCGFSDAVKGQFFYVIFVQELKSKGERSIKL